MSPLLALNPRLSGDPTVLSATITTLTSAAVAAAVAADLLLAPGAAVMAVH